MLLPLKAVMLNRPLKDGTHVIYFQYCYSSEKRVLLNTEISIPKQFWNSKRQSISKSLPLEFGIAENLNCDLARMKKVIEALISLSNQSNSLNQGQFVKDRFKPSLKLESLQIAEVNSHALIKKLPNLFQQIDNYIKSKEKKVVSTAAFHALRDRLSQYQTHTKKEVTFSNLDFNFYSDFVDFLTYDYVLKRKKVPEYGLKLSTIGSTIKNLRVFINDRVRRKIVPPIDLGDFKILDEEADAVYLTYDEVAAIYKLDLTNHSELELSRNLFVLGCLTGLRFSDYSTLEFKDYRKGMLFKKTNKQDNWVVIPLRQEAKEVFIRLFENGKERISNPIFNKEIKEIAAMAGITEKVTFSYKKGNKDIIITKSKAQFVTSHTCRRSFATNEYLAGTDVNLIMKITGHKTFKDFFKYIKVSQEEAAKRIQEVWSTRDNMKAFS
ncbi:MAG: phage integrase SAM-like domain-containing protein [Bacteroidetes bacterium]|nr:phage integrase SAM-like domain-containing protein [Bacteroidota bacterium]